MSWWSVALFVGGALLGLSVGLIWVAFDTFDVKADDVS